MPKLLFFVPCSKVILSQDNTVSLITVFETVNIEIPPDVDKNLPEGAQLPVTWEILAQYQYQPDDDGKEYYQKIVITMPDGKEAHNIESALAAFDGIATNTRHLVRIAGFPISTPGTAMIKLFLKEKNSDYIEIAQYPIYITRATSK